MAQVKQFSYFFLRGYFDSAEDVLKAVLACDVRHYAFIYHDRDAYSESTEDHEIGDVKPPHWHIVINLKQKTSWNVVKRKILDLFPDCGLWNRDLKSANAAADYLTHDSDVARALGKFQYPKSEVFSDNFDYWFSSEAEEAVKAEKVDLIQEFCKEVLRDSYCRPETLDKYFNMGRRDFIFNYSRALHYCADRMRIDYELVFIKPSLRANYIAERNARVLEVKHNDRKNCDCGGDSEHQE